MKSLHIVQNIPSPYRLHLFKEMYKQLSAAGIEFHVHFMSDMSRGCSGRPSAWRNPTISFPHTYWRDYGFRHYHFNPGLVFYLHKQKPDFLLVGSTFDAITSILIAWVCPAAVRCAWSEGNTKTPGVLTGFKGWFKRKVFSKYQYIAVPGSDAVKYIAMHQSLTRDKMPNPIMLPNLVDETRFKRREEWKVSEIKTIRASLGVDDDQLLAITPARLVQCKGLTEYIGALTPAMLKGWRLVILGQGPLKAALLKMAVERGIEDNLIIKDFVPYADMSKYYAAADLFVLPSLRDQNPLSVVEALHSGLPVAVSEMAGNVEEAVTGGQNGWCLPVRNREAFQKVLWEVFSTPIERLREMGDFSRKNKAIFWNSRKSVSIFIESLGIGKATDDLL